MMALILIPCSNNKKESTAASTYSLPIQGLSGMRSKLAAMVRDTPLLMNKSENKRTLVDGRGTITLATDLYNGRLYQPCRAALTEVASRRHPSIHILIVSAFYGLVRLDEGIKIYELQMGDELANGQRISAYWQENGLSSILMQYVSGMGINAIWSLLPKTGYHTVFSDFWLTARDKSIDCFRVDIPGVRQASGYLRGRWIDYMIRLNPRSLLRDPDPPSDIPDVSARPFAYPRC
jgi:cytoplasmic iron level regulating protein YaaA (DUF328/UPF0246 family)